MATLMIQGCTSDAGKSTVVTALCRYLLRRGLQVAPFKPQNMALNSAVTCDGGEIGRAQAVQAAACRIAPHTDHNPVLLKPTANCRAQVIIQGHSIGHLDAVDYHHYKQQAKVAVLQSWERLCETYEAVIVEGAGSPAEINLRAHDIANMGFAESVDCPVWLVADIDRGGVFAHMVGTLACLSESEQQRIKGFIINRFRGDISLLKPGLEWLEQRTGKPVLAVLPFLTDLHLAAEDAVRSLDRHSPDGFRIVVPRLPHISNHTDFDPLQHLPGVDFQFVPPGQSLPPADLIILPGSKNTRGDLVHLRNEGWDRDLEKHLRYGGKVIGICGGYQMLGAVIDDPEGIEGDPGADPGLGWLPARTTLAPAKRLANVTGTLHLAGRNASMSGYEIHHGETTATMPTVAPAPVHLEGHRPDGMVSDDGQIFGCYIHGLFDEPDALNVVLAWAGCDAGARQSADALLDQTIERLADTLESALDPIKARLAGLPVP